MARLVHALLEARAGLGVPERAGILAASTSVGRSFSRGLMPRSTADQAVVTGVSSALNFGLTAASQSLIEAVSLKVAGGGPDSAQKRMAQLGVVLVGDVAAMAAGILAQRVLAQRKDEPIARAWGRTFSWRIAVGGLAGAIIVGSEALLDVAGGGHERAWKRNVPIALPLGGALAALEYHRLRRRMVEQGVTHDAEGVSLDESESVAVGRSIAIGTGVSVGASRSRQRRAAIRRGGGLAGDCGEPAGGVAWSADRAFDGSGPVGGGWVQGYAARVPQGGGCG